MSWNDVEGRSEGREKVPYAKLNPGTTMIRILDNEPYSFWSHWLAHQNTGVTCLGKDCPICAVIAEQRANKDMEKKYNSSQRHALRVWNYATNQMEVLVQGKTFMQQLLTYHKEVGDITGYDIKVIRSGNGTDTTYTMIPQVPAEFKAEGKEIVDVDFKEYFKPLDREKVIQLMEGKSYGEIFAKSSDDSAA